MEHIRISQLDVSMWKCSGWEMDKYRYWIKSRRSRRRTRELLYRLIELRIIQKCWIC